MTCKERRLLKQVVKHLNAIDQKRFGYIDCLEFENAIKKIDEIFKEDAKNETLGTNRQTHR